MTKLEAIRVLYEQAALARRQSESPYNHTCKELHVRKVFADMAAAMDPAIAALRPKAGRKTT